MGEGRPAARWPGFLAAALAVLAFAGTLGHGGVYDDFILQQSPLLGRPFDLRGVFAGEFYAPADRYLGLYRPVGQWSLVLNAALVKAVTGSTAAWWTFHAVNVLLHAAASALLFAWLASLRLPRLVAGIAAVLWAVHPSHAEVAANVTARYESAAAVLGLGFLLVHRVRGRRRVWLAPLLFFAALGCKESAIAFLPLAFLAEELFPVEARPRRGPAGWLGPAIALAVFLGLRSAALAGIEPATPFVENPVAASSAVVRASTAAKVQLLYLRDQLLPLWLSTDHSYAEIRPVESPLDPFVIGFALIATLAAWIAWRLRSSRPAATLGLVGYAILFAAGSNFLFPIGTIMADRLAYAPSIFAALLAALALESWLPRRACLAAVAVAAGLLGYRSARQASVWRDELALFTEQVRTAPSSAKSHGNLADALRRAGREKEAVEEYRRSIEIYAWRPEPWAGLAQACEALREDAERILDAWRSAIRYGTRGERADLEAALDAIDLGDWTRLESIERSLAAADPSDRFLPRIDRILAAARDLAREPRTGAEWNRGVELLGRGDFARAQFEIARAVHKGDVPEGRVSEAIEALARCEEALGRSGRAARLRTLAATVHEGG